MESSQGIRIDYAGERACHVYVKLVPADFQIHASDKASLVLLNLPGGFPNLCLL